MTAITASLSRGRNCIGQTNAKSRFPLEIQAAESAASCSSRRSVAGNQQQLVADEGRRQRAVVEVFAHADQEALLARTVLRMFRIEVALGGNEGGELDARHD